MRSNLQFGTMGKEGEEREGRSCAANGEDWRIFDLEGASRIKEKKRMLANPGTRRRGESGCVRDEEEKRQKLGGR